MVVSIPVRSRRGCSTVVFHGLTGTQERPSPASSLRYRLLRSPVAGMWSRGSAVIRTCGAVEIQLNSGDGEVNCWQAIW